MSTETSIDLRDKYGETNLSNFEVFAIGDAPVRWLGTSVRLGHASPGMTLDYTTNPAAMNLFSLLVRDVMAWTSGRKYLAEGCEERLRQWLADSDIEAELASVADAALNAAAP